MFYINLENESEVRYDLARLTKFSSNVYDVSQSYFHQQIPTLTLGGYYSITEEEYKPDLLSYRIYGSTQYWWILMIYNGLLSNEDFISGMTIRFPLKASLEDLYFSLKARENV